VALFWVADLVMVVVIAAVLLLVSRLLKPCREIIAGADVVLEHATSLSAKLDAIPKLVTTRALTGAAYEAVGAYGAQIERLL
jgi:hypothetical protein